MRGCEEFDEVAQSGRMRRPKLPAHANCPRMARKRSRDGYRHMSAAAGIAHSSKVKGAPRSDCSSSRTQTAWNASALPNKRAPERNQQSPVSSDAGYSASTKISAVIIASVWPPVKYLPSLVSNGHFSASTLPPSAPNPDEPSPFPVASSFWEVYFTNLPNSLGI